MENKTYLRSAPHFTFTSIVFGCLAFLAWLVGPDILSNGLSTGNMAYMAFVGVLILGYCYQIAVNKNKDASRYHQPQPINKLLLAVQLVVLVVGLIFTMIVVLGGMLNTARPQFTLNDLLVIFLTNVSIVSGGISAGYMASLNDLYKGKDKETSRPSGNI